MSGKALWQLGGVLGFVLVIVIGWFLLVSPMIGTIGTNDRLRAGVEAQNSSLQASIDTMSVVDVSALVDQLAALTVGMPAGVDEPELLRQLLDASARSSAALDGVTIQQPRSFSPAAPDGAPLPIDQADLQAAASGGLLVIQLSAQLTGTSEQVQAFADALQAEPRRFLVQTVAMPASGGAGSGAVEAFAFAMPSLAVALPVPEAAAN